MASLMPQGKQQYFDSNGNSLSGGKVFAFAAGTSTPLDTFSDQAGTIPNTNPVVLNARGEATIFWGASAYKVVLKDASDVEIWSQDNLQALVGVADLASTSATKGAALVGFDGGTLATYIKNKSAQVVDSITALKAIDKTKFTRAFVTGYYAAGDGGGGEYRLDSSDTTSSDNGGTIIVASDGGRWKLFHYGTVSLKQFGSRGNSSGATGNGADDTATLQAAITASISQGFAIYAPFGIYRTTSVLTAPNTIRITGDGVDPYILSATSGSWLYFDHLGKGIDFTPSLSETTGIVLRRFGTIRNQPTAGPGWTPSANDWDIYAFQANGGDILIEDVLLYRATKGIIATGRATLSRVRGQAFDTFISLPFNADVSRLNDCHQWTFWTADSNVKTYMLANLTAYRLARVDNPSMNGCFSIFHKHGLVIIDDGSGTVSKLRASNCDFDEGLIGIFVSPAASSATLYFDNVTTQGRSGLAGTKGIRFEGGASTLILNNFSVSSVDQNAIDVSGANNEILIGNADIRNWNIANGGHRAINVVAGNTVNIGARPILTGGNGADVLGGGASFLCPVGSGHATGLVTDASGKITVSNTWKITPRRIHLQMRAPDVDYGLRVDSISATDFVVKVTTSSGAIPATGSAAEFYWLAEY